MIEYETTAGIRCVLTCFSVYPFNLSVVVLTPPLAIHYIVRVAVDI
jgi:hypothetical protein